MTSPSTSLADHWAALATVALLGSDRRAVPDPPAGPVEALVVDRSATGTGPAGARPGAPGGDRVSGGDPAGVLLDQVGLLATVRRAGLRPGAPAAPLVPCPADGRPECPPAAVARLERLLSEWPHLLDEWLGRVAAGGWSLPPEVAVALLARFRTDPARRAVVAGLAGELAAWLAQLFPDELGPRRGAPVKAPGGSAGSTEAAEPPVPDDIARLAALPVPELATTLAAALERGHFANRHRAPLVRLVSLVALDHLESLAQVLARAATNPDTMGLALTLADLAQFRWDLIRELLP